MRGPGLQFDDTIQEWNTCANDEPINATNPCVTADTLVATADGLHRIGDLVGKAAFVIGSDAQPHFVTNIFPTGTKEVFELKTASGYRLELTADHRVLTANRGDVAASELRPDDEVTLAPSRFGTHAIGEDIAFAIGLAVGDGCIADAPNGARYLTFAMSADEDVVLEDVAETLDVLKHELYTGDRRAIRVSAVHRRATGARLVTEQQLFSRLSKRTPCSIAAASTSCLVTRSSNSTERAWQQCCAGCLRPTER